MRPYWADISISAPAKPRAFSQTLARVDHLDFDTQRPKRPLHVRGVRQTDRRDLVTDHQHRSRDPWPRVADDDAIAFVDLADLFGGDPVVGELRKCCLREQQDGDQHGATVLVNRDGRSGQP